MIPVRFPSEEHPGDVGWHIEGSYPVGTEYWANVRSRARGLLASYLFTDVGPRRCADPAGAPAGETGTTRWPCGTHLSVIEVVG